MHQVGLAQPLARGSRVEYRRAGATEWFANGPAGVEQGFTIASAAGRCRPRRAHARARTLRHAHRASPGAAGGLALVGAKGGGAVLRYGDLSVTDASGRSLPARMTVAHGRVLISVDARGARYPIKYDPLVQDAELTNSGEDGEYFLRLQRGDRWHHGRRGCRVKRRWDATEHQGAAFVFTEPEGGWAGSLSQVAELSIQERRGVQRLWLIRWPSLGETIVVGAR